MKKVVVAAAVLVASVSFVLAQQEGQHHGKFEQGAQRTWDSTKAGSRRAWDSTKVGTHRAWDKTKDGTQRGWDSTKAVFHRGDHQGK